MANKLRECAQCHQKKAIPKGRTQCAGCRRFNSDVNLGRIRTPEYAEVNTTGYKEPMKRVEDGFGFYGAITGTNDGRHVQCHICGYYYQALGAHVRAKHKMAPRDYKLAYGLRINDGLLSPLGRKVFQDKYNKYARKTPDEFREMSRKAQEAIKENGTQLGGHGWNAQTRNERGMCRDQTIAKIKYVAELNDGVPIWQTFIDMYGSGQKEVVHYWFGSWQAAVTAAGLESYYEQADLRRAQRRRTYEQQIKDFYKREGRTPLSSDFNAENKLPTQTTVSHLFGSLNNARAAADVPLLTFKGNVGGRGNLWVEE